VEISDFGF